MCPPLNGHRRLTAIPQSTGLEPEAQTQLTWGLCVATLNRLDSLVICVGCALSQTRKPDEIVVVDASDDWERNRDHIAAMLPQDGSIRFCYQQAKMRSLTNQRNQGIKEASVDVLFLIDDDSYLYPDAAGLIMGCYEKPGAERLVGLSLARAETPPSTDAEAKTPSRKDNAANRDAAEKRIMRSGVLRWIYREVLLMQMEKDFIDYDSDILHGTREEFDAMQIPDAGFTKFIAGFALTARRTVILKEFFEPSFLAYCPGEDLDVTYRMGRHGVLGWSNVAKVYHADAAAGRIKRRKATALRALNLAFLQRRHSTRPKVSAARYVVYIARRVLAEFLKDMLSRRFSLPQLRGVFLAIRHSPALWLQDKAKLESWYIDLQKRILQA